MAKATRFMLMGVLLAGSFLGTALAQELPSSPTTTDGPSAKALEAARDLQEVLDEPSVAWQHPDLRYRQLGLDAYRNGSKERALRLLIEASRYADKPSQAMVAAMYWHGEGTAVDRPRAYAWMDLAADRGYRDLLVQRELFWHSLTEAERRTALDLGKEIYDQYSDDAGKLRLERSLSLVRNKGTGSHAGFIGSGNTIFSSGIRGYSNDALPANSVARLLGQVDGHSMDFKLVYDPMLWHAGPYMQLKDVQWQLSRPLQGHVDVGDPQTVRSPDDTQPPV
ncbi:hypothetical protein [Dyella silvae]|uniref:hypothetical protein n=1 Tax=Dyella silvae TaxID=2994424 RepID=UPI002263C3B0|nr:hypothetical protein [Dyella silvae]